LTFDLATLKHFNLIFLKDVNCMGMASGRVILKKVGKNVGLSNDKLQLIASKIKVCV